MSGWIAPDFVALHARGQPRRIACVDLASGRQWSYPAFDDSINRAVAVLARRGCERGSRVALVARNSAWLLIVQQACARMGAVFVPLNWRLAYAEIDRLIEDCEPSLLIFDEPNRALAAACTFPVCRISVETLASAIDTTDPGSSRMGTDADAPSILLYTSGTSGKCKGVIVTERNAFFTACNFGVLGRVDNRSIFLCDSPMFHIIGLLTTVRPALMQGGTLLISEGFDAGLTYQRLSSVDLKVTHYFCVPQMARMLRDHPDFNPAGLRDLTAIFTGGAPNPASNILRWLRDGVRMVDGYGMTEAGTVLGMPIDEELLVLKAGSAGLPVPTLSLRIVDESGLEVADDGIGELQLKGPNVTPGYWRQPEETARAFTQDGWFKTGDLGRRDRDGFITIVDRKKEMFISGGENVYPAEIERVLLDHPEVQEAAVIAVPDRRWGEAGKAFIVPSSRRDSLPRRLERHCAANLARYKIPKEFVLVDALPRTGSGKIAKQMLRDN